VKGTKPLPAAESASVPAVASATSRYLFAAPAFKDGGSYERDLLPATDETLTLKGVSTPTDVKLLSDGSSLKYSYADQTVIIQLPASRRSKLVDVVQVEF
jgi:alpha-L-fucosidase